MSQNVCPKGFTDRNTSSKESSTYQSDLDRMPQKLFAFFIVSRAIDAAETHPAEPWRIMTLVVLSCKALTNQGRALPAQRCCVHANLRWSYSPMGVRRRGMVNSQIPSLSLQAIYRAECSRVMMTLTSTGPLRLFSQGIAQ